MRAHFTLIGPVQCGLGRSKHFHFGGWSRNQRDLLEKRGNGGTQGSAHKTERLQKPESS